MNMENIFAPIKGGPLIVIFLQSEQNYSNQFVIILKL